MIGTQLGPYKLVEQIGSGGMGTVYLAEKDGERVALKVIHPHLIEAPGAIQRIEREAEVGERVRHENVVRTLGWGVAEHEGRPHHFLLTEYVEGRTLRVLLESLRTVPEALLREIAVQVADGLAAIHAEGVVHRDLKPENVLITADQRVRIMDLGVARLDEATALTVEGGFAGSILYAPPEQLRGGTVGPAADLYSFGVLLFELATGQNPFRREDVGRVVSAHLLDEPPPAMDLCPDLSLFVTDVIAKLLRKDPEERFESAAVLREVLAQGEHSGWWSRRGRESARPPRVPVRRDTRLLGREKEIDALRKAWANAKEGRGTTMLVSGEAGIGKTRLIDGLFAGLPDEEAHVLYGAYSPSGFGGISGGILTHFGAVGLEEALAPYLEPMSSLVPAYTALIRHERAPAGAEPLAGDALDEVTCELMRGLAAEKPLLWVIEDLHFADPGSREIVLSLARALDEHRVLLLLTTRPELTASEVSHLTRLPSCRKLTLDRLPIDSVLDIVRDELGAAPLAEKLGRRILRMSDGVPYFVLEILRTLREGQLLAGLPADTAVDTKEVERLEIPSAIRDLVKGRLAQLGEEDRPLVELASVQGFEFDPDLLARVRRTEKVKLLQRLAALERQTGLVRAAGREYRFDHHLVHEIVYTDLDPGVQAEYHTLLADAMSERELAGGDPEGAGGEVAIFLASHHLRGGRPWAALSHLEPALDHLVAAHQNEAVLELCELALSSPELLEGLSRLDILRRKSRILDLLGRFDEEKAVLTEALRLADASGDLNLRAGLRRQLASEANVLRDPDRCVELLGEAIALAREAGDVLEEAGATGTLGYLQQRRGRFAEAQELSERALELATRTGSSEEIAKAQGNLGLLHFNLGSFEEARAIWEDCIARFREAGNRRAMCSVQGNLAGVYYELGQYEVAREHYERQLALAREIGYRRGVATATLNLGAQDRAQGRYASALELFAQDRALCREMGDRRGEAVNSGHLGSALAAVGDLEQARELWKDALRSFREIGERLWEGYALLWLGILAEQGGRLDEAASLCEQALAIWEEIGARSSTGDALLALGRIRLAREETDAAREAFSEALSVGREFGLTGAIVRASAHLSCLPGGDAEAAARALSEHAPRLDRYEHLEARHALYRATGDRQHIERAHGLLEHLKAHAPADRRESMVSAVPLYREVREAWLAAGSTD